MDVGNLNLETLKSSLLFNFRTGNVAIDTIITGLIICLSTYLINLAYKIQSIDYITIFNNWFGKKQGPDPLKNTIIVSGKEEDGCRSDAFLALMYRIKKLDCAASNISQMSEIRIKDKNTFDYSGDEEDKQEIKKLKYNKGANLVVTQQLPFILAKDVEGIVNTHSSKSEENNKRNQTPNNDQSGPEEKYQSITFSSFVYSMDELRNMLDTWIMEYRNSMKPDDYLRYFHYQTKEESYYSRNRSYGCKYEEYRYESGKSFDNIFFPQKNEIIKRIDFFTENKEWYRKRGVPHSIGFLFYGKPGCGKTSTVKAIANYTKRHIVSVPLSKINSCKELFNVFYNNRLNEKHIPLEKRLYVLEDIDADDLKHIVSDRKNEKGKEVSDDAVHDAVRKNALQEKTADQGIQTLLLQKILKNQEQKTSTLGLLSNKLTLAEILEVLDGVMEMDGRMLIMTTNYPERLDEALIRPGRIDMKVHFGKCTRECLIQMYDHFFEDFCLQGAKLWPTQFDKSTLPTNRWTPAETIQILLGNTNNPHRALRQLVNDIPSNGYDENEGLKPAQDLKREIKNTLAAISDSEDEYDDY